MRHGPFVRVIDLPENEKSAGGRRFGRNFMNFQGITEGGKVKSFLRNYCNWKKKRDSHVRDPGWKRLMRYAWSWRNASFSCGVAGLRPVVACNCFNVKDLASRLVRRSQRSCPPF